MIAILFNEGLQQLQSWGIFMPEDAGPPSTWDGFFVFGYAVKIAGERSLLQGKKHDAGIPTGNPKPNVGLGSKRLVVI